MKVISVPEAQARKFFVIQPKGYEAMVGPENNLQIELPSKDLRASGALRSTDGLLPSQVLRQASAAYGLAYPRIRTFTQATDSNTALVTAGRAFGDDGVSALAAVLDHSEVYVNVLGLCCMFASRHHLQRRRVSPAGSGR